MVFSYAGQKFRFIGVMGTDMRSELIRGRHAQDRGFKPQVSGKGIWYPGLQSPITGMGHREAKIRM